MPCTTSHHNDKVSMRQKMLVLALQKLRRHEQHGVLLQ
jgi:hypothetical protein